MEKLSQKETSDARIERRSGKSIDVIISTDSNLQSLFDAVLNSGLAEVTIGRFSDNPNSLQGHPNLLDINVDEFTLRIGYENPPDWNYDNIQPSYAYFLGKSHDPVKEVEEVKQAIRELDSRLGIEPNDINASKYHSAFSDLIDLHERINKSEKKE